MKLVTFDDGKVGRLEGDRVVALDVPDMRTYYERGQEAAETGETFALADVRLRAPIIPKKFFHTAGNFREHHEESKNVNWSHPVLPWIVFFQNIDAIIGPEDDIVYPPHGITNEMDYELELAVVIGKAGKFFSPEEAEDYIAGYLIFNDITARDIQREEMKSGVFSLSKGIDTFCPIGPWIVTPDELGGARAAGAPAPDLAMTATVLAGDGRSVEISRGTWTSAQFSFGQMLVRASADVHLRPGEILGSGTVSTGCLLEVKDATLGRWLQPGDLVTVAIEGIGELETPIVTRPTR